MYARHSTRWQASIPDQVRSMFEYAVAHGIFVPRSMIFVDHAVAVVAGVTDAVLVAVSLILVGHVRAIVSTVVDAVFVGVQVAQVADAVAI